jgi:hypothetical protein
MTKGERENIDTIIEGLDTTTTTLEGCNRSVSRLAYEYQKSKDLSKAQSNSFEIVCKQMEKAIAEINKFTDYLDLYGTREV